jgi:NAD(P)-dependent dehydrogenase (short-subunit alcohol dehydrogenase family)
MSGELDGQTVVVIGGSAGIGFETARLAGGEGANVIVTGRNPDRLQKAADELGAADSAAFDAKDPAALAGFLAGLAGEVDHVMVTAGGPYYEPFETMDIEEAGRWAADHLTLPLHVGRWAKGKVRPGGTLLFIGGTGARRPGVNLTMGSAITNATPALIASLALEIAPVRANVIAPGFVDTPLSASLLGADLDARRQELRDTNPIGRVVGPEDVAALALHLMINTAVTGATYDIDGGQSLVQ